MASKEAYKIIQNSLKIAGFVGTTRLIKNKIPFLDPFDSANPLINTEQKMKFSIKDFFRKYDHIRSFLWIWSHFLKKS